MLTHHISKYMYIFGMDGNVTKAILHEGFIPNHLSFCKTNLCTLSGPVENIPLYEFSI